MNQEALERTRHTLFETNKTLVKDEKLVGSITNYERQLGKPLSTTKFMGKLRKINPNLVAVDTDDPTTAILYLDLFDTREKLFPIENSQHMPEWSVMSTKLQWDVKLMRKIEIPWDELTRGWRTILVRLIQKRLITKTDAEKVFGVGNRASWRNLTGSGFSTEGIL